MSLLEVFSKVIGMVKNVDNSINTGFKFSQEEIREIVSTCKKENLKYLEVLSKMPNLKAFDVSFLLSQTNLNDEKIEIIREAQKIYNEEEFSANGQTRSDFIFRVAANLEYLNMDNIEMFKELVKCKNELYDFRNALLNPVEYLVQKEVKTGYAFQNVYAD